MNKHISPDYKKMFSGAMRAAVIISLVMLSSIVHGQELTGKWTNQEEGIKLTLLEDGTGIIISGNKESAFDGAYSLTLSGQLYRLDFTIQVGARAVPYFAIMKMTGASTIRYIAFLSEELRDNATEEIIETGVLLTREL
jgi:hypothetical protein